MRKRIKYCGITREEDAMFAANLGVDALGFIFYQNSPRYVEPAVAQHIIEKLPPFISTVAVVVNPDAEALNALIRQTQIDLLQFHGEESNDFCSSFNRPFIKAIRMNDTINIDIAMQDFPDAKGFLLDSYQANAHGGTGKRFAWERLPKQCSRPLILAGGLTPENVQQALAIPSVSGIDVSSGIETEPGIKSPEKMQAFFRAAKC